MNRFLISLIAILIILPNIILSQDKKSRRQQEKLEKKSLEYYEKVFGNSNDIFNITTAPEEFKDESIIILGLKVHIGFLRDIRNEKNKTKVIFRKRILINDEAALNEFTEFYYQNSDAVGIQIIKPDQRKIKVDLRDAIKVETDVPDFYKDRYHSDYYYKIAIPNLGVGDILDFYKIFNEEYENNIELLLPVNYEYPILKQEIIFDVDKSWTLYYDAFNISNCFTKDPKGGFDINGRKRKIVKRLKFNSGILNASKDELWSNDFNHDPMLKIMAINSNSEYWDKKKSLVQEGIDPETYFNTSLNIPQRFYDYLDNKISDKLKRSKLNKGRKAELVHNLYHAIRLEILQFIGPVSMGKGEALDPFNALALSRDYNLIRSRVFAVMFKKYLSKYKIDSYYVLVGRKALGGLENFVLSSEAEFGVYVEGIDKYFWAIDNYRAPGENHIDVVGATGIKSDRLGKKAKFEVIKVPLAKPEDNYVLNKLTIKLSADNSLEFNNKILVKGLYKDYYSPFFLYNTDYLLEEQNMIANNKGKEEYSKIREKLNKEKKKRKKKKKHNSDFEEAETFLSQRNKLLEFWIKDEFEVDSVLSTSLIKNGITSKEDYELELDYNFTSSQYVKKAGPNLIFEIGRLIGEQVELSDDQINNRTNGIEFNYVKTIENKIQIELPIGLQAKGLENLVFSVENDIGSFLSTAEQKENIITIKTKKVYKQNYLNKNEWPKVTEFLEAAFQFTQKKVILK